MRAHGRDPPIFRRAHQAGADRVLRDIAYGLPKMVFIHGDGAEPPLPEMARPIVTPVDKVRLLPVRLGEHVAQAVLVAWHDNEMDVIGHQAIGPDCGLRSLRACLDKRKIPRLITVLKKHRLAAVAALRDVMGNIWHNKAGNSGHGKLGQDRGDLLFPTAA